MAEIEALFNGHMDGDNAHIRVSAKQIHLSVSNGLIVVGMSRISAEALRDVLTALLAQPQS